MFALFFSQRRSSYQLSIFQTSTGWGYNILVAGKPVVYQPTIPGLSGHRGFASESQAQKVGQYVVSKVEKGQFPPTLTHTELNQLGIVAPSQP